MKERKPGARGGSRAGLRQGKVRRDDPSHRVAVSLYGNMICYGCNWSDKTSGGKIQTTSTVRLVQDRGPIPPSWRGATGATSTKPALCDSQIPPNRPFWENWTHHSVDSITRREERKQYERALSRRSHFGGTEWVVLVDSFLSRFGIPKCKDWIWYKYKPYVNFDRYTLYIIQGQHLIQTCLIIRIFTMIWYELLKGWKLVENRYFLNLNLVL